MSEGKDLKVVLSKVLNHMKKAGILPEVTTKLKTVKGDIKQDTLKKYLQQVVDNNRDVLSLSVHQTEANKRPSAPFYIIMRNEGLQLKCRESGVVLEVPCFGIPPHRWSHLIHAFIIK